MFWIEALEALEGVPKGKARSNLLKQFLEEVPEPTELLKALNYALSPDITFGVQDVPEPAACECGYYLTPFKLLEDLANRSLTGNAAKEAIANTLGMVDPLTQKWLPRIIRQDLRLNLAAKAVNKVRPGTIRIFSVPLAEKLADAKPKHLKGAWVAQPKADGGRCVAFLPPNGGPVSLKSRTGKEWLNFESIREELNRFNQSRNGNDTVVFDGEVVSYVDGRINFQAIQKTMHAKVRATEVGELHYIVFDACTQDEWEVPSIPYANRYRFLENVLKDKGGPKLHVIDIVGEFRDPDVEELWSLGDKLVEDGWEGLIIRKSYEPVVNDRDWNLIKAKRFDDAEATIIGFAPGKKGTRLESTLGAFICRKKDGTEFEVGSGLDDNLRSEVWGNQSEYTGRLLTYKHFGTTDDGKPRHPIFRYFRWKDDV